MSASSLDEEIPEAFTSSSCEILASACLSVSANISERLACDENSENPNQHFGISTVNSAEITCPICLEFLRNSSYTDKCSHQFCFKCLVDWSFVRKECPMCKRLFSCVVRSLPGTVDCVQYCIIFTRRDLIQSTNERHADPMASLSELVLPKELVRYFERDPHLPQYSYDPSYRFRQDVYKLGLWVKIVYSEERFACTVPCYFREDTNRLLKLLPWLHREVSVFLNDPTTVKFAVRLSISLIVRYEIRTEEFYSQMQPYLRENTCHFLYELLEFAASPLQLQPYDAIAQYECRAPQNEPMIVLPSKIERESVSVGSSLNTMSGITTWRAGSSINETYGGSYSSLMHNTFGLRSPFNSQYSSTVQSTLMNTSMPTTQNISVSPTFVPVTDVSSFDVTPTSVSGRLRGRYRLSNRLLYVRVPMNAGESAASESTQNFRGRSSLRGNTSIQNAGSVEGSSNLPCTLRASCLVCLPGLLSSSSSIGEIPTASSIFEIPTASSIGEIPTASSSHTLHGNSTASVSQDHSSSNIIHDVRENSSDRNNEYQLLSDNSAFGRVGNTLTPDLNYESVITRQHASNEHSESNPRDTYSPATQINRLVAMSKRLSPNKTAIRQAPTCSYPFSSNEFEYPSCSGRSIDFIPCRDSDEERSSSWTNVCSRSSVSQERKLMTCMHRSYRRVDPTRRERLLDENRQSTSHEGERKSEGRCDNNDTK